MAENINDIINLLTKLKNNKVSRFAYTGTAYDNDTVEGAPVFSEDATNNINTKENSGYIDAVKNYGIRQQGSSIPQDWVNHFNGRVSFNLNKVVDKSLELANNIKKDQEDIVSILGEIQSIYSDLSTKAVQIEDNRSNTVANKEAIAKEVSDRTSADQTLRSDITDLQTKVTTGVVNGADYLCENGQEKYEVSQDSIEKVLGSGDNDYIYIGYYSEHPVSLAKDGKIQAFKDGKVQASDFVITGVDKTVATRLTNIDTEQVAQNGRLDAIETEQGTQNGKIGALETKTSSGVVNSAYKLPESGAEGRFYRVVNGSIERGDGGNPYIGHEFYGKTYLGTNGDVSIFPGGLVECYTVQYLGNPGFRDNIGKTIGDESGAYRMSFKCYASDGKKRFIGTSLYNWN